MAKTKKDSQPPSEGGEARYVVIPTGLATFRAGDVISRGDMPPNVSDEDFARLIAIGALAPKE